MIPLLPAMRLMRATLPQQNAAYGVVYAKAYAAISAKVPWPFKYRALNWLGSEEGKQQIMSVIDEALDAAEHAATD